MGSIGSLAVTISADAEDYFAVLQRVGSKAKETAATVGKALAAMGGPAAAVASAVASKAGDVADMFGVPTSAGGFISFLQEGAKEVKETASAAERMGLSIDKVAGLTLMMGGDVDAATKSLAHFAREIGNAASGNEEAQKSLGSLGLDGKKLAAGGMDAAIAAGIDRLGEIKGKAEQSAASFKLFGKNYFEMNGVVRRGAGALDEATKRAKELGLSFSTEDAAKVRAAGRAMKEIELSVTGVKRQLAIEAAPFVTALANGFLDATKNSIDFKETGREVFKALTSGAADFLEVLAEIVGAVEAVNDALPKMPKVDGHSVLSPEGAYHKAKLYLDDRGHRKMSDAELRQADDFFGQVPAEGFRASPKGAAGPANPFDFTGSAASWRGESPAGGVAAGDKLKAAADQAQSRADKFRSAANRLRDAAAGIDKAAAGGAAAGEFDVAARAMQQRVKALEEELLAEQASIGKSAAALKVYKLASDNAAQADIDRLNAIVKATEAAKEQQKLQERAKELNKTDTFAGKLADLDKLKGAGLNKEAYALEVNKLVENLRHQFKPAEHQAAAAVTADSREGFSAMARFLNQGGRQDVQAEIRDLAKAENEKLLRLLAAASQQVEALKRIGLVGK